MSRLRWGTDAVRDRLHGWAEYPKHDFSALERFVLFAGYPRSGHTLVGSLLTAHPQAVVAHEANILRHVRLRFDRRAIFGLLVRRDREFALAGSEWSGYSYRVPEQWQGRYAQIRLLGDKKGAGTSLLLKQRPELLDRLRRTVGVPLHVVLVTRHPLDNIARMSLQGTTIQHAIAMYERMSEAVQWLGENVDVHRIAHEDFVARPAQELERLIAWLGLEKDSEYLTDCGALVHESPRLARHLVDWAPAEVESIMEMAGRFMFLRPYT